MECASFRELRNKILAVWRLQLGNTFTTWWEAASWRRKFLVIRLVLPEELTTEMDHFVKVSILTNMWAFIPLVKEHLQELTDLEGFQSKPNPHLWSEWKVPEIKGLGE
eukprot:TRINITY_DN62312_c0_g2_i1.p1 TRINITY_DN62312_c0_g2~~TRINITY_DN62312_c0_g2_i1.p1  ORF type:complete len:108 (+),score=2.78 TRINITY_DN62312_c0_g2_i1:109-432(+)